MAKHKKKRPGAGLNANARTHSQSGNIGVRAAWLVVIGMVLLVPIALGSLAPFGIDGTLMNDAFSLPKAILLRVLTLAALGAWLGTVIFRGGPVRFGRFDWLILALLGWLGLATAVSVHVPTALFGMYFRDEGLLAFINYALVYFLVLQLATDQARVRTLARALFSVSIPVAAYGVLQYLELDPALWTLDAGAGRAFSTYGNPNILGGFLMFSLPIALALALGERDPRWRAFYWAGLALNMVTLVATFTRGAWIGAAIGLLVTAVVAWRQQLGPRRADIPIASAAVTGVAAIALVRHYTGLESPYTLVERVTTADVGGVGARLLIWQGALDVIREAPVIGHGPDTLRFVFPRYSPKELAALIPDNVVTDNAHNHPLHVAVGAGLIGALLLFAFFASVLWTSAARVFTRSARGEGRLVYGSFWAASTGYLVSQMFGISTPGVAFLLWLGLAVLVAPSARTINLKPVVGRLAIPVLVGVIALLTTGILAQGPLVHADYRYVTATSTLTDPREAARAAQDASRSNPFNVAYDEQVGLAYLSLALRDIRLAEQAMQRGSDPEPLFRSGKIALDEAERVMRRSLAWASSDYARYLNLATLHNVRGDVFDEGAYRNAVEVAGQGIKLAPNVPALRYEAAYAYAALGEMDEAVAELEFALTLRPGHVESSLLLADIYSSSGRNEDALRLLMEAQDISPDEPRITEAIDSLRTSQ